MADPIQVTPDIRIPEAALRVKAVRSGGPGGQNVNKVASKVELRVDLAGIEGLTEAARERLRIAVANRLDAEGWWIVTSERTRDQLANLEDARAKVVAAVLAALTPPKPRHATRPTRGSQKRRVEAKKRTGAVKKARRGGWE